MPDAITRILVPIDFSAPSNRALRYATTLASRFGATLELLHVVEDPVLSGAWGPEVVLPNVAELMQSVQADAEKRLAELKSPATAAGIAVETSVAIGRPAHTVLERARNGRFDMIVVGTHGRTGVSHLVLGSVAEAIVRRAPCPVLTVHDSESGAVRS